MPQQLGLTHKNMVGQATIDRLNEAVMRRLDECHGQLSADDAIEAIADSNVYVFIERDEGTTLIRSPEGLYAVIWYESQFGQASFTYSAKQYDEDAIGFDNQTLGWGQ